MLLKGFFLKEASRSNSDLRFEAATKEFQFYNFMWAKIRCPMDFSLYPFDSQTCYFKFGSSQRGSKEEVCK